MGKKSYDWLAEENGVTRDTIKDLAKKGVNVYDEDELKKAIANQKPAKVVNKDPKEEPKKEPKPAKNDLIKTLSEVQKMSKDEKYKFRSSGGTVIQG
tara:strand:+ start:343 stop:633 length:291 start_codon:yes stop_codon:yes gene_type:complete